MIKDINRILLQIAEGEKGLDDYDVFAARRGEGLDLPVIYIDSSWQGMASGSEMTKEAIKTWLEMNGKKAVMAKTGSLGAFSLNPVIAIKFPGRPRLFFGPVHDYQVESLMEATFSYQIPPEMCIGQYSKDKTNPWEGRAFLEDHHFFRFQERRLLALNGIIDPDSIEDYIAWGGYVAFMKAVKGKTPEELFSIISSCNVRGRSGSGFPMADKWQSAMKSPGRERYIICNADESDPGGFMHRLLMEGNPHLLIEGLLLSSYITSCSKAFIYTRNRYTETVAKLGKALEQARNAGLTGSDILGSGFSLDIELRKGPGAFVCGEETALIASIEGKRGMPLSKPPYPAEKGLFNQPTIVHNVETIAQVPMIIANGPEWYKEAGTSGSQGTKLLSLGGRFAFRGTVEVPFGITLNTIVNDIGMIRDPEKPVKALLIGGPTGMFVHPDEFDTKLDYDGLNRKGLLMGSGSMVLLDNSNCLVETTEYLMSFIQNESCGKCIPCREGTRVMADLIRLITHPNIMEGGSKSRERMQSIGMLKHLAGIVAGTSLCGLGRNAPSPLMSSLGKFMEDWERHLNDLVCDAGVCRDLRTFYINPNKCTGCFLCLNKCPEMAIVGTPRQVHVIIEEKCSGCGICREICKFNAIETR